MISIFTTIQADLSPEFRQKCSNSVIDTESLLQKIGEVTGAVLVAGGETLKFVGSWNSVKNTYDILSGFLLYRSLLGVDKCGEVSRVGIEENRPSVDTFRCINSVYEREKHQIYHPERTHNTQGNLFPSHNALDLTNEHHYGENLDSRMTDKAHDYNTTQQTGNFEGDCMDIEKLSAFYKEETQNSSPNRHTETAIKLPNSSYIRNIPIVNTPVLDSRSSNRNGDTGAIKFMTYSINRKKPVSSMYNEVVHCDECSYTSYSKRNLLFHKARTHIRPYKCKHCGRGFGLMKDLRRHYQKKRDCKQYTFVRYRQVGDKTVEERIDLENYGTNENTYDTGTDQNISFENQQSSQETMPSGRNIDDTMETEVENSTKENDSSVRGDTVSILPLDESQKVSSTDIYNKDDGQTSKALIVDNEMYLKKRSDDEDENTFIVHINKNDNENNENENDDYCVVKINPDMDEGDNEISENSSKIDLSESEHCASTSQDQSCESDRNVSNENTEKEMPGRYPVEEADKSDGNSSSHDTAVVDLSQFSLHGENTTETHAHVDSPSTSFHTGKHHRKHGRKDLSYVVMQSDMPKEPELKMTFPCTYCDYTTHRLKLIDDHVKRVHFKKFECNQCGTRFGLKKDLNRHYRRTHKIDLELQRRGRRPVDCLDDTEMIDEQEDGSRESVSVAQETDIQT